MAVTQAQLPPDVTTGAAGAADVLVACVLSDPDAALAGAFDVEAALPLVVSPPLADTGCTFLLLSRPRSFDTRSISPWLTAAVVATGAPRGGTVRNSSRMLRAVSLETGCGDDTAPPIVTCWSALRIVEGPTRRPASRRVTSITPLSTVMTECRESNTSATMTVPRMPATAFGVRTSMRSPGRMRSRATATATRPLATSTVATPGTSVIVTVEYSRIVTTARPPSRTRAKESLSVAMRSRTKTAARSSSGLADAAGARTTVTLPSSVVTTPARSCAAASDTNASVAIVDATTAWIVR